MHSKHHHGGHNHDGDHHGEHHGDDHHEENHHEEHGYDEHHGESKKDLSTVRNIPRPKHVTPALHLDSYRSVAAPLVDHGHAPEPMSERQSKSHSKRNVVDMAADEEDGPDPKRSGYEDPFVPENYGCAFGCPKKKYTPVYHNYH